MTVIMGDVGQVRVDEDMNVMILLKDRHNLCYENEMRVDVKVSGLFASHNIYNSTMMDKN
jgi:hypothetical protein